MLKRDLRPRKSITTFPDWALVWIFILATLTAGVWGPAGPRPAAANDAPVISGNTATYSGNQQPDPIAQNNTDIYNIVVNSLTTNVGSSSTGTAISLTNTGSSGSGSGDAGANSQALSLTYSGGNFSLLGNNYGAYVSTTGGNGANGSSSDAGGAGGNGGTVTVQTSGPTQAGPYGIQVGEYGIWAGSIGGNGGLGHEGSKNDNGKAGGGGGAGGAVSVINNASISATGYGIFATSQGGGGGAGGTSSSHDGGAGGNGGQSGIVMVTNNAAISTSGGSDYGIYASSLGGAGGAAFEHEGSGTQIGVNGGNGGAGGTDNGSGVLTGVTISNYGAINSSGTGIGAYSAGGTGGNGGMGHGSAAYHSTGGDGGTGGAGGAVSVTTYTNGTVTISGLNSSGTAYGIDARSSGGAGGTGGTGSGSSFPGTGGSGGTGGAGGSVTVTNNAAIDTSHSTAGVDIGINALSTGGNGGQGGTGEGGQGSQTGGDGGGGGAGGPVTVNCNANITTAGDYYAAIAASIGGNGGTGGSGNVAGGGGNGGGTGPVVVKVAPGVTLTGGIWAAGIAGAGGAGGTGNYGNGGDGVNGGSVTVTSSGSINTGTAGAYNNGILAQSWGGAGGAGGTGGTSGSGGNSGAGGSVEVDVGGNIQTATQSSYGILAQSMGGAGGNSGQTKGVITHSGDAGNGADGGAVTVNTGSYAGGANSSILTLGAGSTAICAQSVGGGGGTGDSTSGVIESLGGGAGSGGNGYTTINGVNTQVTVNNGSQIITQGLGAHGIEAQSVGGGGGNGGGTVTAGAGVGLAIGGSGGTGGDGGQVNVITTGNSISTAGDFAHGILAESLGGGGGTGGYAISGGVGLTMSTGGSGGSGGDGGVVDVGSSTNYCTSPISTSGFDAKGILAQSIGGGGGNGGYSIAAGLASVPIAIGGSGGSGGSGGIVNVYNAGAIRTSQDLSQGIFAESVGGGGGNGGYSFAGNVTPLLSASFSFGGNSGPGGAGGAVTVYNTGTIQTGSTITHQNDITEIRGLDAHGILAQSIGGSGGHGGWAGSGSASFSLGPDAPVSVSMALSMGGTGGTGGAGGDVTVNNLAPTEGSSFISTLGDHAYGILAQSLGGGGGAGGGSVAATMSFSGSGSFSVGCPIAIGGDGGPGGAAGTVEVTNQNAIQTSGYDSLGIMAQSISGGGGDGGVSATFALSGNPSSVPSSMQLNPQISVGGNGGDGSPGNTVTVANTGAITTTGGSAIGIEAQSVGGIGGNGNWGFAGNMLLGRSYAFNPDVTMGGTGGIGGNGGTVTVTNGQEGYGDIGAIKTCGPMAHGILAQSLGGGGGNGGAAGTISLGNLVLLDNSSITIHPTISVGGSGGVAGQGGEVNVYNYANITTQGYQGACGIFAQSVGGGGGAGGGSHTINASTSVTKGFSMPSANITASVAVGGKGGDGSYGGEVNVTNTGQIVTQGFDSYGILAQSIGGSGGVGGASYDFSILLGLSQAGIKNNNASGLNINESVSVGGDGGKGSYGGAVTVINSGAIKTSGYNAYGILAQSIGGSGGVGGSTATGLAIPSGDYNDWKSWLVPSFSQLAFEVGGNGGSSSNGGQVAVTNSGAITTLGNGAFGIYAQSIGGGGGVAHYDQCQMFTDSNNNGGQVSPALLPGTLEIGGTGGAGGDGGMVQVKNSGVIKTYGDQASGIYAQSIGGGGGNASVIGGPWNGLSFLQYFGFGADVGRSGGSGGQGGQVTVTSTADITTHGDNANGIFAQSVGGAGGSGSVSTQVLQGFLWNGSVWAGASGAGGTVNVSQTGNITTFGNDSHGIVAQSMAGNDTAGNVTVTLNDPTSTATPGNIVASGLGACGIAAQSLGKNGNGTIGININQPSANTGLVQGGHSGTVTNPDGSTTTYNAYGVLIMDGKNNTLTNYGAISTLDGVSGTAVMVQADYGSPAWGDLTISNYGSISGSVNQGTQAASPLNQGLSLPSGHSTITLNNYAGSTYNAGPIINLGFSGTLNNGGLLNLGTVQSNLTGNFYNYLTTSSGTSPGTFQTTVNGDGSIGQLKVSGTANLGGTLQVLTGAGPFKDGTSSTFLTGNTTGNFTNVILPANLSLVGFSVEYTGAGAPGGNPGLAAAPAANALQVVSHVKSYTAVASRPVDGVLGRYLDQLLAANPSGSIAQVLAQFQGLAAAQFPAAFQSLDLRIYGANTDTTFAITRQYSRTLQQRLEVLRSSRTEEAPPQARSEGQFPLLAYNGSNANLGQLLGQGQDSPGWSDGRLGVWLEGFGQWGNQGAVNGFSGYNYGLTGTGLGIDYAFTKNLILGANFGYSYSNLNLDSGFGAGKINSLYGSLFGTYFTERFYVESILGYGNHHYDNSRLVSIGSLQSVNQSSHAGNAFAVLTEGGYKVPLQLCNLQPFASLSYCNLAEGQVTESGQVATMKVNSRSTDSVVSELGVRVDKPIKTSKGTLVPMLKASWQHDFGVSQNTLPISFVGAPIGVTITHPRVSQDSAVVRAGVSFKSKGGITSSIQYMGELGEKTQNHGVIGQLRLSF